MQARGQFLRMQHEQQPICTSIQLRATEVNDRAGVPSGCTRKCSGSTRPLPVGLSGCLSLHDGLDEQARDSVRVDLHRDSRSLHITNQPCHERNMPTCQNMPMSLSAFCKSSSAACEALWGQSSCSVRCKGGTHVGSRSPVLKVAIALELHSRSPCQHVP